MTDFSRGDLPPDPESDAECDAGADAGGAVPSPEPLLDHVLARLAALSALEYEQVRKAEAKSLGLRSAVLDAEVKRAREVLTRAAGPDDPPTSDATIDSTRATTDFGAAYEWPDSKPDEGFDTEDSPAADAAFPEPDLDDAVARLAAMSQLDYERVRRDQAKALGLRTGVLDDAVQREREKLAQAAGASDPPPDDDPPRPDPLTAADLAVAIASLATLDPINYSLLRRHEAKRLGLSPTELDGFVQRERQRAEAEAGSDANSGSDGPERPVTDARGRTDLFVNGADLPETAHELAARLAACPMLFDRGVPVRLAVDTQRGGLIAEPLTTNGVVNETHDIARPWMYVKARDGGLQRSDVTLPERVAKLYLDLRGRWRLRPLDGIASSPLLAEDGSARVAEGYDPLTRLWCERIPEVSVPEWPTKAEAEAAVLRLRSRFRTFAFADATRIQVPDCSVPVVDVTLAPGIDESAALVALLTAVCRPSLFLAPGLAVCAPSYSGAGTGKGLLVRAICTVAFGAPPVTITAGADAQELEKRIASALMEAAPAVSLDNLNATALRSATLESALTERPSHARVMGGNRIVALNATAFITVTGNGLTLSGDTARRFLTVELDAGLEDPETRLFTGDLLAELAAHRAELLGDVLTIWRWGRQLGSELARGRALGSFGQWSRWCRDPLLALGCADPVDRIADAKLNDPRRRAVADIFFAWDRAHGRYPKTVAELDERVRVLIAPENKGRQFLAARIRNLTGTRLAGFVLVHEPPDGKWSADRYKLARTADEAR